MQMVALQTEKSANIKFLYFSLWMFRFSAAGGLNWFLACTKRQNLTGIFQIVSLVYSLSCLTRSLINFGLIIHSIQLEILCF